MGQAAYEDGQKINPVDKVLLYKFAEHLVVGVSAGFDGYIEDRLLGLKYTLDGYYQCGRKLGNSFDHVFALLEGGYHLDIHKCVEHFIKGVNNE